MLELPRKRVLPLLVMTALLALLAGSAFFAYRLTTARPPAGQVVGSPAIRPDLAGAAGVNLDPTELTSPDLGRRLDALDAAGIRWLRLRLPWDQIEPEQGSFAWTAWDRVFSALAAHPDLQVLVVLDGSPAWARRPGDANDPLAPPQTRANFGAFASAVARRYGGQVAYYQVWDEPNIAPHWGARPVDPADYVGLLREAAMQVRAADPGSRIVLAALAPNQEAGGANQSDITYLDAIYNAGGRAWFDIAAAEPYGFDRPPDDPPAPLALNFGRAALLRDVMVRHGDAGTPLWAASFGWNALPAGWAGSPSPWANSPWASVTEAQQSAYAAAAFAGARTDWPWLGPLFWAADCPAEAPAGSGPVAGPTGGGPASGAGLASAAGSASPAGPAPGTTPAGLPPGDPRWGFALCAQDGAPRPIWQALVDAAAATAPAAALLPPGEHATDDPALHYSPGWRVTRNGADPSANGDLLKFGFYGTGLALRVQGGAYWAYYRIVVDGRPANALPRDETGQAYLALNDPQAAVREAPVARGLALAEHQVELEARGGWDQWALQGILVSAEPAPALPAPLAAAPGALAGLALLAALGWGVAAWPWRRAAAAALDRVAQWAACVPEAPAWAAAAVLGLAFLWSPRWPLTAALLLALAALFWLRPPLMLPLIAAAIPFWPVPKTLLRWQFSGYELLIWAGVAAVVARYLLTLSTKGHEGARRRLVADRVADGPRPHPQPLAQGARGARVAGPLSRGAKGAAVSGPLSFRERVRVRAFGGIGQLFVPFVSFVDRFSSRLGLRGLDWPVLALLAAGLASALAAERFGVAVREFRTVFLDAALFYFLVTRVLAGQRGDGAREQGSKRDQSSLLPLIDGFLAGMAFVSLLALWQLGTGQGRIDVEGVGRVRAFYGSPNNLALVLDRAVPLALALALFGTNISRLRRWAYGLAAPIMGLACLATFSKGALLLGLPVGLVLVVLAGARRSGRRGPLLALAAAVVLAGVALAVLFRTPRFADLTNFQAGTSFIRLKLWQGALHMALDHPLLGVGPDNFLYAYRSRYVLPSAWEELNLSHPHNILLDLWTRLGLLGLAAGAWALLAGGRRAWRLFRSPAATAPVATGPVAAGRDSGRSAATWPIALGLLAGLAATVAHGLIDNSLFLIDLMAIFMMTLGLIQVMSESGEREP